MGSVADTWFTVDKDGLSQLMAARPRVAMLHDLLQNVFDEEATTAVVTVAPIEGRRGRARLVVADDCPDGFADLRDAFTMYRSSRKKNDPTKRGRFNEGEKFVLSLCEEATIATTTGTVHFHADGTRTTSRTSTDVGSVFDAVAKLTRAEVDAMLTEVRRVFVPEGFTVVVNGEPLPHRTPTRTVDQVALSTVKADEDGNLVATRRITEVDIVKPADGETPHIYEMGIPVVEVDVPWHLNVGQKVPLNRDRDNVTPAYRRDLLAAVLDATVDLLSTIDAAEGWVKDALPSAADATVRDVTGKMFGAGWVIRTPADSEADKNAIAHGRTVVGGGALSKAAWEAVRRSHAATSSATNFSLRPDIGDRDPVLAESSRFTKAVESYSVKVANYLLDSDSYQVEVWNDREARCAGRFSPGRIVVNLAHLPKKDTATFAQALDDLLIHECAHRFSGDHLSMTYVYACTRLGAQLRNLSTRFRAEVR